MTEKRWYAARAKPGQARTAVEHLTRQGFDPYYPQLTHVSVRRGRRVEDLEPLFAGYVLVEMVMTDDTWRAVNGTRGIIRLVGAGDSLKPSPIAIGQVESIMEAERAGALHIADVSAPQAGDTIRVRVGFAVDQIGRVLKTRGERTQFLWRLLGGEIVVWAPSHTLEVVARAQPSLAPVR